MNRALTCLASLLILVATVRGSSPLQIDWQRSLGSSGGEYLTNVKQTRNGDIVLVLYAASVSSEIDGNKTSPNFGNGDGWVVRLDSTGHTRWERTFGGTDADLFVECHETESGELLLFGVSFSGTSGNKTSPAFGNGDFWIVCVDQYGEKLWERTYGGSGTDSFVRAVPIGGGGFVCGGIWRQ